MLLLIAGSAWSQDTYDTHGKTEAQILQMGMDKWSDFYTSREGTSTASMTQAAGIYGDVARKRNDKLLSGLHDSEKRSRLQKLRKLIATFSSSAVDVAYCEAGGGTMFNTMWAAVTGTVEDALHLLITQTGPKPKPMVVSAVRKRLTKIGNDLKGMHRDDKNSEFFKYKESLEALAKMRSSFDQIVEIAKDLSRTDSDRILGFCHQAAVNVDLN